MVRLVAPGGVSNGRKDPWREAHHVTGPAAAGSVVSGREPIGLRSRDGAWKGGCFSFDILAAIAISDNVNVLSLPLGGGMLLVIITETTLLLEPLRRWRKGFSCLAPLGTQVPMPTVSLTWLQPPWITTVVAGTLDRDFPIYVSIRNRLNYFGVFLYWGNALSDSPLLFVCVRNASNVTTVTCVS